MAKRQDEQGSQTTKSKRKISFFLRLSLGILVAIASLALYIKQRPTIEDELEAINARYAIPDEENAALIYAQLLFDPNLTPKKVDLSKQPSGAEIEQQSKAVSGIRSRFEQRNVYDGPLHTKPWHRAKDPKLAQWIDGLEHSLNIIAQGAEIKHCFLPAPPNRDTTYSYSHLIPDLLSAYNRILQSSAYLDWGEGCHARLILKAQLQIAIGRHLQAPPFSGFLSGIQCEKEGLSLLNQTLIHMNLRDYPISLESLCSDLDDLKNTWDTIHTAITHLESTYAKLDRREQFASALRRLDIEDLVDLLSYGDHHDAGSPKSYLYRAYHDLLSHRRRHRLLIEMRRFKDKTGDWPHTLDPILGSLSQETLQEIAETTPFIHFMPDRSFVMCLYGTTDDSKTLSTNQEDCVLVVYDRSPPSQRDLDLILDQVHCIFDSATRSGELGRDTPIYYLSQLLPLSAPILLLQLQHPNLNHRLTALEVLRKLSGPNYRGDDPNTTFLPELIDAFRQEQSRNMKHQYINIFEYYDELSSQESTLILSTMIETLINANDPEIHLYAAKSLLRTNPLDALEVLLKNHSWFENDIHFGEGGNSRLLPLMGRIACSSDQGEGVEEMYMMESMLEYEGYGMDPAVDPNTLKNLRQWWQENQDIWINQDINDTDRLNTLQKRYREKYQDPNKTSYYDSYYGY